MRLAYADEGPGPVVVLLHGFPLGRAMWDEQVSGIGSIYRIIAPDLRGHGDSPAPEGVYTIDEMADDVIELLDTLASTCRSWWAGSRWGATWPCRWWRAIPSGSGPDADGHAGRGRFARGGRRSAKHCAGRAGGRQSRPVGRGHDPSPLLQDHAGGTPGTRRADARADGANTPAGDRRGAAGDGRFAPTVAATWPRSACRRSSSSARTTWSRRPPRPRRWPTPSPAPGSRSSRRRGTWPPTRTPRSPTA